MAVGRARHERFVQVLRERGGDGVQRRRHRRREDRRHDEAGEAGGKVPRDEVGEDLVGGAEGGGRTSAGEAVGAVEGEEEDADEEEADELREDDDARRQQRQRRGAGAVGAQIPLHQVLIRAVRRHRQETAADDTGPEGEGEAEARREVEDAELMVRFAEGHRRGEPAGDVAHEDDRGRGRADDVDPELHDLDPDDRLHPAVEREDDHDDADADDAEGHDRFRRDASDAAVDRGEDEGGEEEAHAVGDGAHGDEEGRGQRAHPPAEALLQ